MSDAKSGFGGEIVKAILGPVSDPYSDVLAVALGDRIANWRLRNVMRAHAKTQAEAERLGLKLRPDKIPNRYAFAWFEEVSKQDDDDMQTLFARLLAGAASDAPEADERLVRMLGQLTPNDAKVFQYFYETPKQGQLQSVFHARSMGFWNPIEHRHFVYSLRQDFGRDHTAELEALELAGCLSHFITTETVKFPERADARNLARTDWAKLIKDHTTPVEYISHTALGWSLAKAVLAEVAPLRADKS